MLETRLARPDEVRTALRLVVASHRASPDDDVDAQVDALINWTGTSNAPARHAHVLVLADGRPVVACLCFDTAGKVGMLLLPSVSSGEPDQGKLAGALRCVVATAIDRGLNFVQVMCDPSQRAEQRLLSSVGFKRLAVLDYMERATGPAPPVSRGAPDIDWRSYVHADPQRFATAVEATYRDSRDCPALSGLRTIDDVLESHRATGDYLPEHWYIAEMNGADAGVLILAGSPLRSALEIAYMGVAPVHRGRGLGMAMLHKSLAVARAKRVEALMLAVDASNLPALSVYRNFGFARVATREAWYYPTSRVGAAPASDALSTSVHADGS